MKIHLPSVLRRGLLALLATHSSYSAYAVDVNQASDIPTTLDTSTNYVLKDNITSDGTNRTVNGANTEISITSAADFKYSLIVKNATDRAFYIYQGSMLNVAGNDNVMFSRNMTNKVGGAFSLDESASTFSGNGSLTFNGNSADGGGAIYLSQGSMVNITANYIVTFSGNSANAYGGALYLDESTATINGNGSLAFSDNSALFHGGVFYQYDSATTISGNTNIIFSSNWGGSNGGAFYLETGSSSTISGNGNLTFSSNSAEIDGGVFYLETGSTATLRGNKDVIFSGNWANANGGAFYINDSASTISENRDVTFISNLAGISGGALYLTAGSTSTIIGNQNVTFNDNSTDKVGGAVSLNDSTVTIRGNKNLTLNGNSADGGGAFYLSQGSILNVTANDVVMFSGNSANIYGGALYLDESTVTINGNGTLTFSDNSALFHGSVFYQYDSASTISGNGLLAFNGNSAKVDGGVFYLDTGSTSTISGNEEVRFIGNSANSGGAFYLNDSTLTVSGNGNVIFRGNSDSSQSGHAKLNAILSVSGSDKVNLSAPQGKSISFFDPIVTQDSLPGSSPQISINGSQDGSVPAGAGSIILSGQYAEQDLNEALHRQNERLIANGQAPLDAPDERTWQKLLTESRTTSIKGNTVLYGGSLIVRDKAVYKGASYQALPGSVTHLSNGAGFNFSQNVLLDNSRLTVSGSSPSQLSAGSDISMAGTNLTFMLQATGTIPMLTIAGQGLTILNGNTVTLSPDEGISTLADGTYTLLRFDGAISGGSLESILASGNLNDILNLEGMSADHSQLLYDQATQTLIWTASGICIPELEFYTNSASAGINTLWAATRALQTFTGSLASHSNLVSIGREGRGAIWFDSLGSFQSQSNDGNRPGYDFNSWGASLGGEYRLSPRWTIGAGIGSIFGKNDGRASSYSVDQDIIMGGLYATNLLAKTKNDSFLLTVSAGYGHSRNDGDVYGSNRKWSGKWNDHVFNGGLRFTWVHALNERTSIYSYAGADYTYGSMNDLHSTQTGALRGGNLTSVRLPVGVGIVRRQSAWTFMGDVSVLPDVGRDNPDVATAGGYRIGGANPGRCAFGLNLGAAYEFAPQWSMTAGYHLETTGDSTQQNASIGIQRSF